MAISLDDIKFEPRPCSAGLSCDFENDFCQYDPISFSSSEWHLSTAIGDHLSPQGIRISVQI